MRFLLTILLAFGVTLVAATDLTAARNQVDPGSIAGRVIDVHGNGVADARVEVEIHTRNGRVFHARTHTDRRGHFSFPKVAPGKGGIRAIKRGVGRDAKRLMVHPGEDVRVRLELH